MGRLPYWSARSAGYSITRLRSPPALSCFAAFALMRRSFEARVDRVAMSDRGTKVKVTRRTRSARQSRASFRFCSCVRKRSARMASTPSFVSRRPASRISRARTVAGRLGERATSKRSSTAVETLFTFCPPGPEARMNSSLSSDSGISMVLVTRSNPTPP